MGYAISHADTFSNHSLMGFSYQQDLDLLKRKAFFHSSAFRLVVIYWLVLVIAAAVAFVFLVSSGPQLASQPVTCSYASVTMARVVASNPQAPIIPFSPPKNIELRRKSKPVAEIDTLEL